MTHLLLAVDVPKPTDTRELINTTALLWSKLHEYLIGNAWWISCMIMRKNIWERLQLLREQAWSLSPMSLHRYQSQYWPLTSAGNRLHRRGPQTPVSVSENVWLITDALGVRTLQLSGALRGPPGNLRTIGETWFKRGEEGRCAPRGSLWWQTLGLYLSHPKILLANLRVVSFAGPGLFQHYKNVQFCPSRLY